MDGMEDAYGFMVVCMDDPGMMVLSVMQGGIAAAAACGGACGMDGWLGMPVDDSNDDGLCVME